ncbi:MAG: hypothetical protein Q3Y08_09185 [Butyricicoccus sp.]|nr:hypothetical protein [Butyricicoccus sp.]
MKRLLALSLAVVLSLSLAACGGEENRDTDSGSNASASDAAASSQETVMTEEEMLADAVTVDEMEEVRACIEEVPDYLFSSDAILGIYALHTLYEENPVVFVETYFGKPYCISGYVDDITKEGFDLEIEPDAGENLEFQISVTLADPDEIREIKKGDLITIVGMLTEIEGEHYSYLSVDSAYIVS